MNFTEIQDVLQTFLLVSRENGFKFFFVSKQIKRKNIDFQNAIKEWRFSDSQ